MIVKSLKLLSSVLMASSSLVGAAFVPAALAQDQPAGQEAASDGLGLDEIVVTARRRPESVQSAPLSVSALSGAALEERNIQSAAQITNFVPNVQFDSVTSESGGGATAQISIRGIGQTDHVITIEPAVGVYLDGVYIGKSVGALLDTVDLAQIEVLRGPQGTLFGKNAIAGAIQMVSKRPSDRFEAYIEGTTGTSNRADGRGSISGPLSDWLRARLSVGYQSRDGYVRELNPDGSDSGRRQGNVNRLSGRLALEADLGPNLLATFTADGSHIREQNPATVNVKVDETAFVANVFNAGVPGGVCLPSAGVSRFSNPFCYNSSYARPLKSLENFNSVKGYSDTDTRGVGLNLDWKIGESMTLKSISSYRNAKTDSRQEISGHPYYISGGDQHIDLDTYSQEIQLLGNLFDKRLNYVLGLFYLKEKGRQVFPVNTSLVQFNSGGDIDNDTYAAFGQITYELTDQLSITGGLRYSEETRRFDPGLQQITGYDSSAIGIPGFTNALAGAFGPPGSPLFPGGWYSRKNRATTPMVSASYKFTPDILTYATFSKGQKGGAFTMRYFPAVVPAPGTDPNDIISYAGPETATSYEIGLKTELFDRRLRFNVAAFYTDYKDIQITYNRDPDGPGPIGNYVPTIANAGTEHIKGIEVESSAVLTDWLRLDGSLGYIDAKYVSFSPEVSAAFPGATNLAVQNTPKWTANIGGTATLFDNANGKANLRVDYSYRSGQYKEFTNDPVLFQKAYGILGANFTYDLPGEHLQASVGATNITKERYIISGFLNTGIGIYQATPSRGREWFVRLRYTY